MATSLKIFSNSFLFCICNKSLPKTIVAYHLDDLFHTDVIQFIKNIIQAGEWV